MISVISLEKLARKQQTSLDNVFREYCQHLFLSYLYQKVNSEKILFKGGTALRIVLNSPRFSEDLDFTGFDIRTKEIEDIITSTLAEIESTGIEIRIEESKKTTGGYLAIIIFSFQNIKTRIQVEISLRKSKRIKKTRSLIVGDYISAYTLIHLPVEDMIKEKLKALFSRKKPRDFYDYFFLLSANYSLAKEKRTLEKIFGLLRESEINFKSELRRFLPASHVAHFKNFKKILEDKILSYLGKE